MGKSKHKRNFEYVQKRSICRKFSDAVKKRNAAAAGLILHVSGTKYVIEQNIKDNLILLCCNRTNYKRQCRIARAYRETFFGIGTPTLPPVEIAVASQKKLIEDRRKSSVCFSYDNYVFKFVFFVVYVF